MIDELKKANKKLAFQLEKIAQLSDELARAKKELAFQNEEKTKRAAELAVADVVDAMSSLRPYRASLGIEKALEEIEHGRNTLYDATVVDACLKLFRDKSYTLA